MARPGTNTNTVSASIPLSVTDGYMAQIPEPFRRWLHVEAGTSLNPVQLVEIHRAGMSWADIWEHCMQFSQEEHKTIFGGVYPGGYRKDRGEKAAIAKLRKPTTQDYWDAFMRA